MIVWRNGTITNTSSDIIDLICINCTSKWSDTTNEHLTAVKSSQCTRASAEAEETHARPDYRQQRDVRKLKCVILCERTVLHWTPVQSAPSPHHTTHTACQHGRHYHTLSADTVIAHDSPSPPLTTSASGQCHPWCSGNRVCFIKIKSQDKGQFMYIT